MPDELATAPMAAKHFGKSQSTIRSWARRYMARTVGVYKGLTVYDFADLATIEAFLYRRERVPQTPELRDAYRAELRNAA